MTALSIVQTAQAWLSLPVSSALFSATDPQAVQLRALMNEEIAELARWPDCLWRKALRQYTFTTTATEVQPSNALPADFEYVVPGSMFDRTLARPMWGPITPEQWQLILARPIVASYAYYWRLRGNDFLTAPNPPAGDTIAYEYASNLVVYALGDTVPTKQQFTADDDTSIFNETMVSRGVRWRFLAAKGLAYDQAYSEWISLVQREASRSKSAPILNAAGMGWDGIMGPYVPDLNFPG